MRYDLLNPLIVAYVGDAVFEVYVRDYLVLEKGIVKTQVLQKEAIKFVSAKAQANFVKIAMEKSWLSEEEVRWYKWGRNTKNRRSPKNTGVVIHNQSTGFETIIGMLHLEKKEERIQEIFNDYCVFVESQEMAQVEI